MEKGPLDARVLRSLLLEALTDHKNPASIDEDDNVVLKGYLIDPDKTIEPSVVDVISQLDRRSRQSAA